MDISLSKVQEIVKDREAWHAAHHGFQRVGQDSTTEQQQQLGPNIPGSYAILFFTTSDFTFTTRHIHNWVSFPLWPSASLILELLVISLCSSPVSYWTFSDLGRLIFQCHIFLHFHTGHGFPDKHTGVVCHFLIQWTIFCQNSSLWPSILGSPAWKGS